MLGSSSTIRILGPSAMAEIICTLSERCLGVV